MADDRGSLRSPLLNQQQFPPRVLFVCTANICRSPTAEYIARQRVGSERWVFRSAGFLASGRSPDDDLVRVLAEHNVDLSAHRSYQIDVASLRAADLVLTMEGSHVQQAIAMWPDAWDKTVPLRHAATLIEASQASGMGPSELLEMIRQQRDPSDYLGTRWDVSDPYGRGVRVYRRSVAEIESLVDTVLTAMS